MAQPDPRLEHDAALLRATDRDLALLDRLGDLVELVGRIADDLITARAELAETRTKVDRLELRLNAEWLRERGLTVDPSTLREAGCGVADDEPIDNVVELIRDYAPDHEPIPTTDVPAPDSRRVEPEGGDTVA